MLKLWISLACITCTSLTSFAQVSRESNPVEDTTTTEVILNSEDQNNDSCSDFCSTPSMSWDWYLEKEFTFGNATQRPVFTKTRNACKSCSCDGYWGYKHSNGTFEGPCRNTDNWGHRCNHSPQAHGLRAW